MTSDFDKDEIQDSVFPVEFTEESSPLDLYGVWVKSGPRDADPSTSERDKGDIRASVSVEEEDGLDSFAGLPDFEDIPDISGLPDLPDFDETPLTSDQIDISSTLTGESFAEEDQTISFGDLSDFDAIAEEESIITDSMTTIDTPIADITMGDDFQEIPIESELPSEMEIPADEFDVTSFNDMIIEETITEKSTDVSDGPSDDDFSSFLDDLNTGSQVAEPSTPARNAEVSSFDDLDLDSFIDSVNETGGTTQVAQEQLYSVTDPVDLDLDFDEDFIADAAMIKASGSSVSESEYMDSDFGVELIDETPAESAETFDELISSVQSETSEVVTSKKSTVLDPATVETSEFDDLLLSLDAVPAPSPSAGKERSVSVKPKTSGFNLSVVEDDGHTSMSAPVTEETTDELNVPLFEKGETFEESVQNEPARHTSSVISEAPETLPDDFYAKNSFSDEIDGVNIDFIDENQEISQILPQESGLDIEENLAINDIKDYNNTKISPEAETDLSIAMEESVPLDFDDLTAVENELNDLALPTGENEVVNSDKSTELLMIIADELTSIKNEISTLKTELAEFRATGTGTNTDSDDKSDASNVVGDGSGFFSDDDPDEAIALTGDELNNILITADFTEEKTDDVPSALPSVLAATDDTQDYDIPETLPDSIFDIPSIENTAVQVAHITKVEDDISYLEGNDTGLPDMDDVAIEEPDLEIIDFDDEKLEEPELDEFNIDLTDIEQDFPAETILPEEQIVSKSEEIPSLDDDLTVGDIEASDFSKSSPANSQPEVSSPATGVSELPVELKDEIKSVLTYMDQLLESLPEEKIEEFARSEHFEVYKKLFEELGIS